MESEKGIRFDSCANHGVWFDHGHMVAFTIALKSRIAAEVQRAKDEGRNAGISYVGLFALLDALAG